MRTSMRKPVGTAGRAARTVAAAGRRVPLPTYGAAILAGLITAAGLSSLF